MITSAFLTFFAWLLTMLFSPFPRVTELPDAWVEPIRAVTDLIGGYMSLPVFGTMVTIAVLTLSILAAWQVVVFANWLYNKIRGSG